MQMSRRHVLRAALASAVLPATSQIAAAQAYPNRPVKFIVGFAAGGGNDIVARLMGQWLSERTGQTFIVENRPGAGTNIATEAVIHSPPDGYTLLLVPSSAAINATLYSKLNFNFIRDIAPIGGIVSVPNVMFVHPSSPVKTVAEFIDLAKSKPGKLTMASAGSGSASHLAGEMFKLMTGIEVVHVPYRGNAPGLTDLLAGQVDVMFPTMPGTPDLARTGKLRALAVTTSTRSDQLPDVPTIGDTVKGYEASQWYGMGAPKNTPRDIIDKLNSEIRAGLKDPGLLAKLADVGGTPLDMTPEQFGKLIADETEKWGKVLREANIKAD